MPDITDEELNSNAPINHDKLSVSVLTQSIRDADKGDVEAIRFLTTDSEIIWLWTSLADIPTNGFLRKMRVRYAKNLEILKKAGR